MYKIMNKVDQQDVFVKHFNMFPYESKLIMVPNKKVLSQGVHMRNMKNT